MISEKIDIFLESGNELNISAVAKKRYTNQSTISRQIRDLEKEWGFALFKRSNRGLRLTPQGAIMLDCCRKLDHQMNDALQRAKNLGSEKREKLRLAFLTDINAEELFMPAVLQCAAEHENLDIALHYGSFGDLRKALKTGQADIVFTYDFELRNIHEQVVVDYLTERHPCLVIGKEHPLYRRRKLTIQDLREETFFLPEESDSPGREQDMLYVLRACHVPGGKICFVPNQESVFFQVRLGRGVAMIDPAARQIGEYELRVISLDADGHFGKLGMVAVWKKDNLNPMIALAMQMLHGRMHI